MKLALLLGLALSLQLCAQPDPVLTRLSHVRMFAFGGVGFAAARTQGETDYDSILARATAKEDFEKVFAGGSPEAKAYALVALHKLDPERFKVLSEQVKPSDSVQTGRGCLIFKWPMGKLLARIGAGDY